MARRIPAHELAGVFSSPAALDDLAADGPPAVVVEGPLDDLPAVPPLLPVVVVGEDAGAEVAGACPAGVDVVASGPGLDRILATVGDVPLAATALAVLLRAAEDRTVSDGLLAESSVYGVLQAGPEFARWRVRNPPRARPSPTGDAVRVERAGDVLRLTLARPEVRNALDADLRDGLAAGLQIALADPAVTVELAGDGPAFCSGGHLDEFGTRSDPASAHRIRLARNLGWLLHQLAPRTRIAVHGACRGSGVELPAFAGTVVAQPDATFGLPELAMGLVPGAGGTISLPRRIGRHRTAWLALTGEAVDAETARRWGLVDELGGSAEP